MKKMLTNPKLLTQAVLASTFFVAPIAAQAVDYVNAVVNAQQQTSTSADNTIEITLGGQINMTGAGKDAVLIDAAGTTGGNLIIDALNKNGNAVVADVGFNGINFVNGASPNGTVTIGVGSTIDATVGADAILVGSVGNSIFNQGIVQAGNSGININGTGTNTTIINAATGTIFSTNNATILSAGAGLTMDNWGIVQQSTAAQHAILLGSSFVSLTNNAGSIIEQNAGANNAGDAIVITGAAVAGQPNNITNNAGGQIVVTGIGNGINVKAASGSLINAGFILQGDAANQGGAAIELNANVEQINNSGIITSANPANATIFNANAGGIIIENGLVNTGNIINLVGGPAIDFGTKLTNAAIFQNGGVIGGSVLLAESDALGGSNVLTMTGGTITNGVVANGTQANTITISGGTIGGALELSPNGDTVNLSGTGLVNEIIGDAGDDTIHITSNLTGGGYTLLDTAGGNNTLQIDGNFTSTGVAKSTGGDIAVIVGNDTNSPIFTLNGQIQNAGLAGKAGIEVSSGATMVLNGAVSNSLGDVFIDNGGTLSIIGNTFGQQLIDLSAGDGQILNAGTVSLGATSVFNVDGNAAGTLGVFTNQAGGVLLINTNGIPVPGGAAPTSGQMIVNDPFAAAVNLAKGSFIQPTFNGFMPAGTAFTVITANTNPAAPIAGAIFNEATFVQPSSAVVFFTPTVTDGATNSVLTLTSGRNTYTSLSNTAGSLGVAGALDTLAQGNGPADSDLFGLLTQLDQLPTQAAVEAAMQSLAPIANGEIARGGIAGFERVVDGIGSRIEDLRARRYNHRHASLEAPTRVASNGLSFGDPADTGTVWVKGLGTHLDQDSRDDLNGYKADVWGVVIGGDWGVSDCVTLGVAGSYTKASVNDKNDFAAKDLEIKSWQGTVYGSLEFQHGIFLDALLAVAGNDFNQNRVINVNNIFTGSQADFDGTTWAGQADLGWSAVNNEEYYFAPFARLRYTHQDLDDYTETGAGNISLNVQQENIDEFLGGLGFRLGTTIKSDDIVWVPEISAMVGYDFTRDGEVTTSNFIGGGPAFITNGVQPGRTVFDLGLGLSAKVSSNSIFTVKYNLEVRDDFTNNGGSLQFTYLWS